MVEGNDISDDVLRGFLADGFAHAASIFQEAHVLAGLLTGQSC